MIGNPSAWAIVLLGLAACASDGKAQPASAPAALPVETLDAHVRWLADPAREGREPGSDGHDQARDYLVHQFTDAGLHGGSQGGGFVQSFEVPLGEGRAADAANVIGFVPGRDPQQRSEWIVVSAHYDHLGLGRHAQHEDERGTLHPGADDNASGVTVLLALAHRIAASPLQRTVVFAAFSGEEAGAVGSRHYLRSVQSQEAPRIIANINLDMVGRLGEGPVQVLGTATSPDWDRLFTQAADATGISVKLSPGGAGGSDQQSFINERIPGVQVFTGGHGDYHRPSDTADRIDVPGLASIERLIAKVLHDLALRDTGLAAGLFELTSPRAPDGDSSQRRITFGVIPEFGYIGAGVKVDGVRSPESPAALAGIEKGDVIEKIAGNTVRDLRHFAELLRSLEPDVAVSVVVLRSGERMEVHIVPASSER